MELRFSLDWASLYLVAPRDPASLALNLFLGLFLALAAFAGAQRDRRGVLPWLVGLAAAAGGSVLAGSLWLEPKTPVLQWALGPRVPILGLLPVCLAAWFGGVLPAGLAAAAVGFVTAGQGDHSLASVLTASLAGLLLAHLLRQELIGRASALLRRPAVAALLTSLLWPVPFWRPLTALTLWKELAAGVGIWCLLVLLGPGLVAGVLGEAFHLLHPAGRPVQKPTRVGPHQRSLAGRLMVAFIPALLFVSLAGMGAANALAARIAAQRAETALPSVAYALRSEMEWTRRAAESALSQMAVQVAASPDRLSTAATLDARGLFSALWVLDPAGEMVSAQPDPPAPLDLALVLQLAQNPNAWAWTRTGEMLVQAPLLDAQGDVRGYLVGAIPARERIAALLADVGSPFPAGLYFFQPQSASLAQAWFFQPQGGGAIFPPEGLEEAETAAQAGGRVARFLLPAGFMGFALPVEGCEASLGLLLPVQALAASALGFSWPLLAVLTLSAVGAAAACAGLTTSALHPLERLVQAAGRIARGHWSTQVQVASPDEVGRLALAIEEMRRTLQARGQQIALLADLAEGSLEHDQVQVHLVRLLRGLLRSSEANASAVVVWGGNPEASSLVREQEAGAAVPGDPWIKGLAGDLALQRAALFHERLLQPTLVDRFAEPLALGVQAVAALPLALNGTYLGMLYVQYPTPQNFSQMDRGLLLALARQAALLLGYADARTRWGQAEQELHTLLEASYDPALVLSAEGRVLTANRAAERAFAFDLARWRGRPVTSALAGEDLARLVGRILTAQAPLSAEGTVRGQRTFAFRAVPFGTDGRPAGWVLVARDMSDLKALDALKKDFVTAFSHDLKAPLQRVRSLLTVIPMFSELTAKQKELLQTCTEQLDSLSALIGGIVELAQVEGAQELHLAPCQLAVLLSQAAEEHRAAAKGKGLRVHLEIGAQPPLLLADEGLVRLALRHLLDNAIRFTPSGGQVVLGLAAEGEHVTLYVRDTGMGIPLDEQPRVFERFYRGREAIAAGIPGNGLGLAVVRAVAEAHGGRAWVESAPGEGSTFYLALPRAGRRVSPGEPAAVRTAHEPG